MGRVGETEIWNFICNIDQQQQEIEFHHVRIILLKIMHYTNNFDS